MSDPARSRARRSRAPEGPAAADARFLRAARRGRKPLALIAAAAAALTAGLAHDRPTAEAAAPAAQVETAIYDLYFGGIPAGETRLSLQLSEAGYSAEARGRAAGFISALVGGEFSARSEGAPGAGPAEAKPALFSAQGSFAGDALDLRIEFGPEAVRKVVADPPYDPKPWQIDPTAQRDVYDPLAAIALLLREQADGSLCDLSAEIFDGRRRLRATLGAPAPAKTGEETVCAATIERVAGFKPKSLAKPPIEFSAYFDRPDGGPARLSRVVAPTDYGVATAVRRDG